MFNVKKRIITAIIVAGLISAAFTFTSCTLNSAKNNNEGQQITEDTSITARPEEAHFSFLEHKQKTPDVIQSVDKETIYISTSVEEASFVAKDRTNRPSAKKINEVLTKARERSNDVNDRLVDELDAYLSLENADISVFPWESRVDYDCLRNDGKAISVLETVESYTAGTLTATSNFSYNFDPLTGDHINQVFYIAGDKASFDEADDVMYKKLVSKYGEETISYNNVASSFVEIAEQCWYFTEGGVKVMFNVGTVADPEVGTLELEYTKEELPELAQKYFN
ncbi:MAG: hypothetical protein IJW06_04650 [Clostridia bacterium]|nr:hypothetical protein [Clostridia bacterium]